MFERLLIPLDGSPFAESALAIADLLPSRLIYLLRVERGPSATRGADRVAPGRAAFGQGGDAYLQRVAASLRNEEREVEVLQGWGDPATRIVEAAADVDCIVMTTHGRGGAERAIYGSVADHVVRHAPAPVLLVPRGYDAAEWQIMRILVPLDGSGLAEAVMPTAVDLAQHFDVPIHLVRVVEGGGAASEEARRYVDTWAQRHCEVVSVTVEVRVGKVPEALHAVIDPRDLVVMSTHGRQGVRRFMLGSVADALVRQARAPILLSRIGAIDHRAATE